jgi:hypothetical protein
MLVAAVLATVALGGSGPDSSVPDRYYPVLPTTLTLAHERMGLGQGGQRVHVTIPATPGVNAWGDTLAYEWDAPDGGKPRCRPGALPDVSAVTAGTVVDAPLAMPPSGWCRGWYSVSLRAAVTVNCSNDPPPDCTPNEPFLYTVAGATFRTGRAPRTICHHRGEVERCWTASRFQDPASWSVTAPLDDLLGRYGATSEADPYFDRAFRHHPVMRQHWELDDNLFYGWPHNRAEAVRMSKIVDRVLRAGRYHHTHQRPSKRYG